VIWALAALAACGSPAAATPELSSFVAVPAGSLGAPTDATSPPTVRVSAGRIEIFGLIDTPDPCQLLTAEFTRSSQDLHLRVSTRSTGGACILILGRFAYTAVIIGLPAGVYNFDVTHTYPDTGWPTSVVVTQSAKVE